VVHPNSPSGGALEKDPVCGKDRFWLVQGFDSRTLNFHIPDPGLFRTYEEACEYCNRHSSNSCIYGCRSVMVGRVNPSEGG